MTWKGTLLTLDLATVTGFAVGTPTGNLIHGEKRFGKAGGERSRAYRNMRLWLDDVFAMYSPSMVTFESAANPMIMQGKTNINTIKLLIGFTEHVEEYCYQKVELREASVQQVRASFLGSNRIKSAEAKLQTKAKCRELGHEIEGDNAADAIALWYYQMSHLRPDLAHRTQPLFYGKRPIPQP